VERLAHVPQQTRHAEKVDLALLVFGRVGSHLAAAERAIDDLDRLAVGGTLFGEDLAAEPRPIFRPDEVNPLRRG
jgi:hypothetical protein